MTTVGLARPSATRALLPHRLAHPPRLALSDAPLRQAPRHGGRSLRVRAEKRTPMFVPADGFGGERPETKGAAALSRLFTFVAIRIVQAQLEGLGGDGGFAPQATGMKGNVESPSYDALRRTMEEVPLGDGDSWIEALMERDSALALRLMSVREAYALDFDWQLLAGLTARRVADGNTRLMRAHVERTSAGGGAEPSEPPQ